MSMGTLSGGNEQTPSAMADSITRNGDNRGATVHEFWVSSDNVTFTQVATLNAAIDVNNGAVVNTDTITMGRYVKYVAAVGPNYFAFLVELMVFGVME